MKSFFSETLNFLFKKFGPCPNCMSSANIVAEIRFRRLNERALSIGEYVTLLHSFHRGTLSLHWYIAQNF